MMCCTLYSLVLFFVQYNILDTTVYVEPYCTQPWPWYIVVVLQAEKYIAWLPSYFLGVGAMLNLNKWVYFSLRIRAFIMVGRGIHEFDSDTLRINNSELLPNGPPTTEIVDHDSSASDEDD